MVVMASDSSPKHKTLYNNPMFSDVKISQICNGNIKEYSGHRAVLSGRSGWFMKAFTGPFKETSEEIIEMHDDDPKHFDIMLEYLYTYQYQTPSDATDFEKRFLIPIGLHILADKYDVEGLAAHAVEAFACGKCPRDCCCVPLNQEECEQVVRAYYQFCASSSLSMGKVVADYILVFMREFMYSDRLDVLVQQYPVLGADMVLSEKRKGILGKCGRPHKVVRG